MDGVRNSIVQSARWFPSLTVSNGGSGSSLLPPTKKGFISSDLTNRAWPYDLC